MQSGATATTTATTAAQRQMAADPSPLRLRKRKGNVTVRLKRCPCEPLLATHVCLICRHQSCANNECCSAGPTSASPSARLQPALSSSLSSTSTTSAITTKTTTNTTSTTSATCISHSPRGQSRVYQVDNKNSRRNSRYAGAVTNRLSDDDSIRTFGFVPVLLAILSSVWISLLAIRKQPKMRIVPKSSVFIKCLVLLCLTEQAFASQEVQLRSPGKVCKSTDIRNSPETLKVLADCSVIEGYLVISLMDKINASAFDNYSFPLLTEITEFLLVYRVNHLRSLGKLFPNLAVIRGNELFEGSAMVLYENTHLEEIGLKSLTTIKRGSVSFLKNPVLCYAETIDWSQISWNSTNDQHFIVENKNPKECPICPGENKMSAEQHDDNPVCSLHQGRRHCWNSKSCQKICPAECKHNCNDEGKCCNEECAGGCSNSDPKLCTSCLYMVVGDEHKQVCTKKCPSNYYSYLDRSCITAKECLAKTPSRKFVPFKSVCTDHCPNGFNKENTTCVPCQGKCDKECEGSVVESIADAKTFIGCTHIVKSQLVISIKQKGPHLMSELESAFSSVEVIKTNLRVINTQGVVSLSFFKNLREISGEDLHEEKYALYVLENRDLSAMWGPNQTVYIANGRLFFHFNPQLCYANIDHLRTMMKNNAKLDKNEVATDSNGSKGSCNTEILLVNTTAISTTSAVVRIHKPMKWDDERAFIGYQYYYQEAPQKNITLFGQSACDDSWKGGEATKYDFVLFSDLKPYTQYAYYVKTYTISSEPRSGQSPIQYFQTRSDQPSPVVNLRGYANSSSEIIVAWQKPALPNSNLAYYRITASYVPDDPILTRNFCKDPIKENAFDTPPAIPIQPTKKETYDDCSCEKNTTSNDGMPRTLEHEQVEKLIDFENAIQNFVYVKNERFKKTNATQTTLVLRRRRSASITDNQIVKVDHQVLNKNTSVLEKVVPGKTAKNDSVWDERGEYYLYHVDTIETTKTEYVIRPLKHFALYQFTVEACRDQESGDKPDTKLCSRGMIYYAKTRKLPNVDKISSLSLELEATNTSRTNVRLHWTPPENVNGLVVSYTIAYTNLDAADAEPEKKCITEQDYNNFTGGYLLTGLTTGNYSIQVRPNSLAGEGIFSSPQYIFIPKPQINWWIIAGVIMLVMGMCAGVIIFFVYFKKKYQNPEIDLKLITSVNPDYLHMQYQPDEWEIGRDNVIQMHPLGQGSFGMVYEGVITYLRNRAESIPCAIKTVNENATDRERYNFLEEASTMKKFNTYHVVKLLGVVSVGQPTLVVMELMRNGDLKAYLRRHRPAGPDENYVPDKSQQPPTLSQILQMAIEIADGMAYLAASKFVHRDLAARNCMVAEDLTVKIGDFGMTRDIYETDYYRKGTKGLLPVRWMAPESLKDGVFSSASDVFSYGVVLWEMATLASQPYQGLSNDQVLRYVIDGGVMQRPENCPDRLYSMMTKCWAHRSTARPSFFDIINSLMDNASAHFEEVSFFHTPEGRAAASEQLNAIVNQPHNIAQQHLDEARIPLRAGETDFNLNIDEHSDNDHHRHPLDEQGAAANSPYSLGSAILISSTPGKSWKHSLDMPAHIAQSNQSLSVPSTSAAALQATRSYTHEHTPLSILDNDNDSTFVEQDTSTTKLQPVPVSTNRKRTVADTVQNVSNSLVPSRIRQMKFIRNHFCNNKTNGGNNSNSSNNTSSNTNSNNSGSGSHNSNGHQSASSFHSMSSEQPPAAASTSSGRSFFSALTPSHTTRNPNYLILDESTPSNAQLSSLSCHDLEDDEPRLYTTDHSAPSTGYNNCNRYNNSNKTQNPEQCNLLKDTTNSFKPPAPPATATTTSTINAIEPEAAATTPYQLKEQWLRQPPPNGFVGRES